MNWRLSSNFLNSTFLNVDHAIGDIADVTASTMDETINGTNVGMGTTSFPYTKKNDVGNSNVNVDLAVDKDVIKIHSAAGEITINIKKVAYIIYGYLSNKKAVVRFHLFIKGALETWLEDNILYYVLNYQWKSRLDSICQAEGYNDTCSRLIPIYVNCTEGHHGFSPCCKMEQGLLQILANHSHYDWYVYQDDDMYIKTRYMDQFLVPLSPQDEMVLTAKPARTLINSWGKPQLHSNCSIDKNYLYPWGQPVVYSKAGLERIKNGLKFNAMTKICSSFGITHDVGNPIMHWMYMLPEVRLPGIPDRDRPTWGSPGTPSPLIGVHGYGRNPINRNATALHNTFGKLTFPDPPYKYKWHRPIGYMQTQTYHLHGNASDWTEEWYTIPVSDCKGPKHKMGSPTRAEILNQKKKGIV